MSATELQEIEKKKRRGSGTSCSSRNSSNIDKHGGALDDGTDDPEVRFIQPNHADPDVKLDVGSPKIEFNGLTKEELMKFAEDPFWKKVRWVLFILFWVLWVAMLVAAILIIVLTPKCPYIPKQTFWQKSSGYHIDVANFKDTDGNGVGDLKGVIEKIDYLKDKAGFLVLSSIIKGSLGTKESRSTAITDFKDVDPLIGTLEDVKALMKKCRQNSMKAVIEFYPHTGIGHEWFKKAEKGERKYRNYYIWKDSAFSSKMVNRVGMPVSNTGTKFRYWSSLHKSLPALNLNNSDVLNQLQDAVKFWMTQGFDGIFIDNAAFLAPEIKTDNPGVGMVTDNTYPLAKWYKTGHNGQLYTDGSVRFIQEVRQWVDAVQKKTDRERLLLVSSGNTGLIQDRTKTLAYLGDSSAPGAHSVILFDLMKSRGAKFGTSSPYPLRSAIDDALKANGSITSVTQTLTGPRSTDFILTSLNLLLPTTAVTLYGEEIGISGYSSLEKNKRYPEVPYWYITKAAMRDPSTFKKDMIDSYDVPMQWKLTGGFSTYNTSKKEFRDQNVMSLSTIGRGQTRLDVYSKLIKLAKEHSLNWGAFEWFETQEKKEPNHYIFSRAAKGFPTFIVIAIKPSKSTGGLARDLSNVCEEATPVVSFPSNEDYDEATPVSMSNVYFHYNNDGSVYVFKCE